MDCPVAVRPDELNTIGISFVCPSIKRVKPIHYSPPLPQRAGYASLITEHPRHKASNTTHQITVSFVFYE